MGMTLTIDYITGTKSAVIRTDRIDDFGWGAVCRFLRDHCASAQISGPCVTLPWHEFLRLKAEVANLIRNVCRAGLALTPSAVKQLQHITQCGYYEAIRQLPVSKEGLLRRLEQVGFSRTLTPEQCRNVCKLASLPAGATFSVPGAGKTTEALAYFFYHARPESRLLVVAPKNAFGAWDEQLDSCVGQRYGTFVRLTGGGSAIQAILKTRPRFSIISYTQFPIVRDLLTQYLEECPVFMFLDESHRIKAGSHGVAADAIISVSHLPVRKLILSGTPMPQSEADLDPQMSFLYPELSFREKPAAGLIRPIYVRTTKDELHLPRPIVKRISLPLKPKQAAFYQLLRSESYRDVCGLSRTSKRFVRQLGHSVVKLMQFASNPALLTRDIQLLFSKELSDLLLDEGSPKIEYACMRARELAAHGQKCIIWSSFVNNVELIAHRLSDLGADHIHGGVDAGSEWEANTREGKLKRFHQDPDAFVLVANPAAASEGISLHTVCHTAIYIDRSFNAAQYLQSVDRIHRLGLPPDVDTTVEILECAHTVDQVVFNRLAEKIDLMAKVLNDPSLAIQNDPYAFENDVWDGGIDDSDVQAVLQHLGGGADG